MDAFADQAIMALGLLAHVGPKHLFHLVSPSTERANATLLKGVAMIRDREVRRERELDLTLPSLRGRLVEPRTGFYRGVEAAFMARAMRQY
jgi:hypothetical protein